LDSESKGKVIMDAGSLQAFLKYNDWADGRVMAEAAHLSDAQLDQIFEIGLGTLRKTVKHICDGEMVWLERWKGHTETSWPPDEEKAGIPALQEKFAATWRDRGAFLQKVSDADLGRLVRYRDSKGSLFDASLGEMIMQGIIHSLHHRAQAVNILRRLGAGLVELDYMMWVRKPVKS
jgi:uncharacterized damage-inducible protein DinB